MIIDLYLSTHFSLSLILLWSIAEDQGAILYTVAVTQKALAAFACSKIIVSQAVGHNPKGLVSSFPGELWTVCTESAAFFPLWDVRSVHIDSDYVMNSEYMSQETSGSNALGCHILQDVGECLVYVYNENH